MPDEHPIPEQTDELAIRLYRAHRARINSEDSQAQTLDDLQPGMQQVWRNMALVAQDVLGVGGAGHAMAVMDNIAASHSRTNVERIRDADTVTITPDVALRNVFGDVEGGEWT